MTASVAITGLGVMSPLGHGVEAFWSGLLAGRRSPDGAVPPFERRSYARSPLGRRIDRTSLLALAAARLALADAGLAAEAVAGDRSGLCLGTALGNLTETASFLDRLFARGAANPLVFPNLVLNAPLAYVSIELGITGPTAMVTEQEASGEAAIAHGADLVATGRARLCLAGGADELDATLAAVLGEARLLTRGVPRPLDPAADGVVLGEGAAVVVLEPLAAARQRGARIYACVQPHPGFAVPAPVHGWATDARAVAAGLRPLVRDADVVFAGASGSPPRDALEAEALALALDGRPAPVTAVRGTTGDFGAAGALDVAAAALALASGIVPPTLGTGPQPRGGLAVVRAAPRRVTMRSAVVPGLARGGMCRPLRLEAVG